MRNKYQLGFIQTSSTQVTLLDISRLCLTLSKENNMPKKISITFILVLILALAACGTNAPAGEVGGEGGVEAALVTHTDAALGFSIGYPGTWTQDTTFTNGVKFVGGDDWMTLEIVTPPAGTDVMIYAQGDVAAVSSAFPGFAQLSLAASTEVINAVVLGFTANGTSTVTGKAFTAHNERYYIGLSDGRIAVLTVVGPENHYDREGVRDIALTLKIN
jgi:hypothetical protein